MPTSAPRSSPARARLGLRLAGGAVLAVAAAAGGGEPVEIFTFFGEPGAQLGVAVAGAGDVDRDGFADLLVGATDGIGNGDEPGNAFVYSGRDGSVLHHFTGDFNGDAFGTAVAGAGDVDGDGFDDVVVGARYSNHNGIFTGTVTVFSGRNGSVLFAAHGDEGGDRLGYSVAGAGDVDGDGLADVIAGAIFESDNGFWSGSAWVFAGPDGHVLHKFDGDQEFDLFGTAVAGAGDVDGDGLADVIVGATDNNETAFNAGLARVFSGADGAVLHTFHGDSVDDRLGNAVAGAGDLDGDGRADLLVAAVGDEAGGPGTGTVFVFSGADGSILRTFQGSSENGWFGYAVAGVGDADGDGTPDLLVGAPFDDAAGQATGSATLISGRDGGRRTFPGGDADDVFGVSVAGAGDLDGDGLPDLFVGANHDEAGGLEAGSATAFSAGLLVFGDGFESGDTSAWSASSEG